MAGKTPEELIHSFEEKISLKQEQIDIFEKRKQELLTMVESGDSFEEWFFKNASTQEKNLWYRMNSFRDYFSDMIFDEDSIIYEYLKFMKADGTYVPGNYPLPFELGDYFTYNWFRTEVKEIESGAKFSGSYDGIRLTLRMHPDYVDDDSTLLHEMIHLHEMVINDLPWHYHDILYWALYQDLCTKIDGLDDAIKIFAHLPAESKLYSYGGEHDILFLLKSLDLDMRMEYEFGKVLGYGYTDKFKHLKVK